jgi:hypothetical protein
MTKRFCAALTILWAGCVSPASPPASTPRVSDFPLADLRQCDAFDPSTIHSLDAVIAIDTSRSTVDPVGIDVNANGETGDSRLSKDGDIFAVVSTDPGDSYLALQVAAGRSLVHQLAGFETRFALVSYSGVVSRTKNRSIGRLGLRQRDSDAIVEAELTSRVETFEAGLERILAGGSFGNTDFAAGMSAANEVLARADQYTGVRKRVLFMSDSTHPAVQDENGRMSWVDPEMKAAAEESRASGVVFHTFRLGTKPVSGPTRTLAQIAGATGGSYTHVTRLDNLPCVLARSLSQ